MESVQPGECQRISSTSHCHVVQSAFLVRITSTSEIIPTAVQHAYMIELKSFGTVCSQQKESTMSPTRVPSPLSQPLNEVSYRHFRTTGFQFVIIDCLMQQFAPISDYVFMQPCPHVGLFDDT